MQQNASFVTDTGKVLTDRRTDGIFKDQRCWSNNPDRNKTKNGLIY